MAKTSYICKITAEQAELLGRILAEQNWELDSMPYAHWRARRDKTTVVAYESGKLVTQGKGTADFVQFTLEPQVLGEARFGYEEELAREEDPEKYTPHAGIDESGKGDFFGPLVIAAVYTDEAIVDQLAEIEVQDSKGIKSAKRIAFMAGKIRDITNNRVAVVTIGPAAYNRLYAKMDNVNRMLAWGHARALEDLLERVPDCPRALSDQFGNKRSVLNALMRKGRNIKLDQRPKAESDPAVAAASIVARHEFVRRIEKLGESIGVELPKGASKAVLAAAAELIRRRGFEQLGEVAKMHFVTAKKAQALASG